MDNELLDRVLRASAGRLKNGRILASGERLLVASADHAPSQRPVLLTIARPGATDAIDQLSRIARMLGIANNIRLGTVVDRYYDPGNKGADAWGCLVTSWHENATTLAERLVQKGPPDGRLNVLDALTSIFKQVRAIHRAGFVHGDISPTNVVVSPDNTVHVVDFEYVTDQEFAMGGKPFFTPGYSPPTRLTALASGDYDMEDARSWDLYALGRLTFDMVSDANPYDQPELTLYNQRALRMIGGLLLGRSIRPAEIALGLDSDFFVTEAYRDLEPAIDALNRLRGRDSPAAQIPELSAVPASVVEARLLRPVPFTDRTRRLMDTAEMQSIASCLQLGLVNFIWPTATHTRLEHAIGTFGMACAAVTELYADPQSPIFRILATPRIVRTMITAALLHDVGHYPLAHDLEEAFDDIFDHETRSERFILSGEIARILKQTEEETGWDVNPFDVASVINGTPLEGSDLSHWTCEMLHSIISGALDVDKLDYLVRDSYTLGVAAGAGIDVQRVLSSLTVVLVPRSEGSKSAKRTDHLQLAVRAKGVRPAELVGRIRSHMFGVVYWHHSYRAIKAMIHWIVWMAVMDSGRTSDDVLAGAQGLAQELFASLDASLGAEDGTPTMLPGFGELGASPVRISPREGAVLAFIADRGGAAAKSMFKLLAAQSWYRIVLTADHYDNAAATSGDTEASLRTVWDTIEENLYGLAPQGQAIYRVALAETVQRHIVEWLVPRSEGEVRTRVIDWGDQRDRFVLTADHTQLILVDLVETKKSKDKPLYFAVPEKMAARLDKTSTAIPVRRSFDQMQLQKEFVISNGAIRVLCHPDFATFLGDTIPSETLLSMLEESVAEVSKSFGKKRRR